MEGRHEGRSSGLLSTLTQHDKEHTLVIPSEGCACGSASGSGKAPLLPKQAPGTLSANPLKQEHRGRFEHFLGYS